MKRAMILGLALAMSSWTAAAGDRHRSVNLTTDDNTSSDDCSVRLRVSSSDFGSTYRDETTSAVSNQPLTIRGERNGGIQVTTWDQPQFSIKLCKQVVADNEGVARRALRETKLQISGGDVSVSSPESSDDYSLGTLVLVKAPRGATVSLSVHNGGISLRKFDGTAEAHTMNGGIALNQSTGKLTVVAQNGGVSIKDCSGDVNAQVQNGGLSITLPEQWSGKGMEAHAQNGGMTISVPKNFGASLEVSGSNHVGIICKGDICNAGQRTWDNGHKIFRLGGSGPQVRASTVNGGIVIEERGHSRADM
jgi:DUF4097 and DUF4098 domain-containing protein YvlB